MYFFIIFLARSEPLQGWWGNFVPANLDIFGDNVYAFFYHGMTYSPLFLFLFTACLWPVPIKPAGPEPIYNVETKDGKIPWYVQYVWVQVNRKGSYK